MKSFLLIALLGYTGVFTPVAFAENKMPWALHPRLLDLNEGDANYDRTLHDADVAFLAELREDAIREFARGRGLTREEAAENIKLIDWELTPFSNLVLHGKQTEDLRTKTGAGSPGTGKSAIDRYISERVKNYIADPERMPRRSGAGDDFPDLAVFETLQKSEKELKQLGNGTRYRDKRLRFWHTYGKLTMDEFAQYLRPPKDLEAEHQKELHALLAKIEARVGKINDLPTLHEKDLEPDESKFITVVEGKKVVNEKAKELELARVATRRLEEQVKRIRYDQIKDEGLLREIERVHQKWDRIRQEHRTAVRRMKMLWQAAAGGKYVATAEKKESEDQKNTLTTSAGDIAQFAAKWIESPVLAELPELMRGINQRTAEIRAEELAQDGLRDKIGKLEADIAQVKRLAEEAKRETLAGHEAKIRSLDGISDRVLAGWIYRKSALERIKKIDGESLQESLVEEILRDIHATPGEYLTFEQGHDPNAKTRRIDPEMLEEAAKFKRNRLTQFRKRRDAAESAIDARALAEKEAHELTIRGHRDEIAKRDATIATIDAERKKLVEPVHAYGREQKEHEGADRTFSREKLIEEYNRLAKKHDANLVEAARSSSGRVAVNDFIASLTEQSLEKSFPDFCARLRALHNDPKIWLENLKRAPDIDVKFAQLMRLDGRKARELVFDAVTKNGYKTEEISFENVNILFLSNLPKPEAAATELILKRRLEGKHVTPEELHAIYSNRELVPVHWDELLFEEMFPFMMAELRREGQNVSAQAAWRRLLGHESLLFKPPTSHRLVDIADTTLDNKFVSWKKSLPPDLKAHADIEFYVHESVPPLFVEDDKAYERGVNVVAEPAREVMNEFLNKIHLDLINAKPTADKPFKERYVLVNYKDPHGGPDRLVVRKMPRDFQNPNIIDPSNFLLRGAVPDLKAGDVIAARTHTRVPAAVLQQPGEGSPHPRLNWQPLDIVKTEAGKTADQVITERRDAEVRAVEAQQAAAVAERARLDAADDQRVRERAVEMRAAQLLAEQQKAEALVAERARAAELAVRAAEEKSRLDRLLVVHHEQVTAWEKEVARLGTERLQAWQAHLKARGGFTKFKCWMSGLVNKANRPDPNAPPSTFQPLTPPAKPILNLGSVP